jgi:Domain of unknown function (DUF4388)
MALEGELKDFNILEVIQLLGQQGKTGVLRVSGLGKKGGEAEIFLFEGKITHATSSERTASDLLGERLAKTGVISPDDLRNALRSQKKSGRFLGEIVVDEKMVKQQVVLNALYAQIHELVYEVFRYEAGKFKFDPLSGEVSPKVSIQLPADEVMLNILRMVDEWPEIEKKAPAPTMILQKSGTLEEHGIELSDAHAAVYRLVNGTRSVQEIIDMSLVGKFTTLEILGSLLEGGDIREAGIKRSVVPSKVPARVAPRVEVKRQGLTQRGYVVGFAISLILLLVSLFPFKLAFLWTNHQGEGRSLKGYAEGLRKERVEWGKKIFFLERGRYPESARELVGAGIVDDKDLQAVDVRGKSNHT